VVRSDGQQEEEFLFNLAKDPGEQENLLRQESERLKMLKSLLESWERDVRSKR
jgi:hypothetical protein